MSQHQMKDAKCSSARVPSAREQPHSLTGQLRSKILSEFCDIALQKLNTNLVKEAINVKYTSIIPSNSRNVKLKLSMFLAHVEIHENLSLSHLPLYVA